MPRQLNPDALRFHRKHAGLSRAELADRCRCTLETIARWERGKCGLRQQRFREALPAALDVSWDTLCQPPKQDAAAPADASSAHESAEEQQLRNLSARVPHHAHLAFALAKARYGVDMVDVVTLAPLLFMLIAEQSLADRQSKIEGINGALHDLLDWKAEAPQFARVLKEPYDLDDALRKEQESIDRRELFGADDTDPFAALLQGYAKATKLYGTIIESIAAQDDRSPPSYWVGKDAVKAITGMAGETELEATALQRIWLGRLDLRELVSNRNSRPDADFWKWLAERVCQPMIDELLEGGHIDRTTLQEKLHALAPSEFQDWVSNTHHDAGFDF